MLFLMALGVVCVSSSEDWAAGPRKGDVRVAFRPSEDRFVRAEAMGLPEYQGPPLTVELWARVNSSQTFNILLAYAPKESVRHWELYTYAGEGDFSVYMPGVTPAEIRSGCTITDGKWHYLGFVFHEDRVKLYVDGNQIVAQPVVVSPERTGRMGGEALTVGRIISSLAPEFVCDGAISEVRISGVARDIRAVPAEPFSADEHTVGLWQFDMSSQDHIVPDTSTKNNPIWLMRLPQRSLDEIDLLSYDPLPSPMDGPATILSLLEGPLDHPGGRAVFDLSGPWVMAEGGTEEERLHGEWPDAVSVEAPGSVHGALVKAGIIPDPKVGKNDAAARENSFKTWWFKRVFALPEQIGEARLVFDGVAIRGRFWLNGKTLGEHEGMFGGPCFDVTGLLRPNNILLVRIDPAPHTETGIHGNNQAWRTTVVFNNCWGWHYSNIPALGIWRPVRIEAVPAVRVRHPFIVTRDARQGLMDLNIALHGPLEGWSGVLGCSIEPHNFQGKGFHFTQEIRSESALKELHFRFAIPEPRLWWPVDQGAHNLYRLRVSFKDSSGGADFEETVFGIRTIAMAPLPGGPYPDKFNWTFVINGRPTFVKGANWCTMDPLMDFSYERYERFVSLAASQHIQMFRAWGSGMPETDAFYAACNQYGIMVLQEWPTAWNSHLEQPFDILEETVRLNTLRLRNNPSLVMWGAGNESSNPFGSAIDMMGRLSVELDGTRPFHRGEPWGGSVHNYDCYWGRRPLDRNLSLTGDFVGEFGLASMPALESVLRYLPEAEKEQWPPPADGSLAYHTPIFNTAEDMARLTQYSSCFMPQDSLQRFIIGSQLAQATGVRHALEFNRTRWPQCTGVLYYKMNDNYPAASWSCADWYGVPKIGHYVFQDSFAPLLACVLFESLNSQGQGLSLPVFVLDDADLLAGARWRVLVRAYDAELNVIKSQAFEGEGAVGRVRQVGRFELAADENRSTPLLIVSEVIKEGTVAQRTFYWTNYEAQPGCLFELPQTLLELEVAGDRLRVTNKSELPAVGVHFICPEISHAFLAEDGHFWLDPGETRAVCVSRTDGVSVAAWNAPPVSPET